MRDSQRQRVYSWEVLNIAPYDRNHIHIKTVQPIVDFIWKEENREHPPQILKIDVRSKKSGQADRLNIWLMDVTQTWIVLHEISHSLTMDIDGNGDLHGPIFVKKYMELANKYLKIPMEKLKQSADSFHVKYAS